MFERTYSLKNHSLEVLLRQTCHLTGGYLNTVLNKTENWYISVIKNIELNALENCKVYKAFKVDENSVWNNKENSQDIQKYNYNNADIVMYKRSKISLTTVSSVNVVLQ